jgi:5S rRNA maturation endonuclease (ribonuclease M5)
MDIKQSYEDLLDIINNLSIDNNSIPVIVEGLKDIEALRNLGLKGEIIGLNMGKSLTDFCDYISSKYSDIIILTDWDRRGGLLCRRIMKLLKGRVKYNTHYREMLAKNTMIKTVEGLPSWMDTIMNRLENNIGKSNSFNHQI